MAVRGPDSIAGGDPNDASGTVVGRYAAICYEPAKPPARQVQFFDVAFV
jgi:hypothetical protein